MSKKLPSPSFDFDKLKHQIFKRLETELPPNLYYHGVHHTRDDVLPATERLAKMLGIGGEELMLLRVAALYHDIGYIYDYGNHEAAGVKIVQAELPSMGFTPAQIEHIGDMIMATRIPQAAASPLAQVLCDADMDSLGREDFLLTSHCLLLELRLRGLKVTLKEWYQRQAKFLEMHRYFTTAARQLRDAGQLHNLNEIRDLLDL